MGMNGPSYFLLFVFFFFVFFFFCMWALPWLGLGGIQSFRTTTWRFMHGRQNVSMDDPITNGSWHTAID